MKFVCSHNSNHSTLPTSFGSHEVAISEISINNSDGTKKSNVFEPNPTPVVNPLTKASNIGTIYWDPKTQGETVIETETQNLSSGYQSPSTALFHEVCHALRYARNPERSKIMGTPVGPGKSDQFDTKEEEIIITGAETKYINEINAFEKSKVGPNEDYYKQSTRANHIWNPSVLPVGNPNDCTQVCDKQRNGTGVCEDDYKEPVRSDAKTNK